MNLTKERALVRRGLCVECEGTGDATAYDRKSGWRVGVIDGGCEECHGTGRGGTLMAPPTNYRSYPGLPKQVESTYLGRRYLNGVLDELTGQGCHIESVTHEGAITKVKFVAPEGELGSAHVHFYNLG